LGLASKPSLTYPRAMTGPRQDERIRRLQFRAWHRGTREADYMIGCYFDRFHAQWSEDETAWFEALLDEEDHDILAWALGTQPAPARYAGSQMLIMQQLDYVEIPR
jgi:antitoxin CptB